MYRVDCSVVYCVIVWSQCRCSKFNFCLTGCKIAEITCKSLSMHIVIIMCVIVCCLLKIYWGYLFRFVKLCTNCILIQDQKPYAFTCSFTHLDLFK